MLDLPREMRAGKAGDHPPRSGHGVRLWLLAAVLSAVLMAGTMPVGGEPGAATLGLDIPETTRIKQLARLEPPLEGGGDGRSVIGGVIQVSVATNVRDWGLAVHLSVPGGKKLELRPEAVVCRLRDGTGLLLREKPVEGSETFVEGNGKCGSFEFLLEVVDVSAGGDGPKLSDLLIEVGGLRPGGPEERDFGKRDR